MRWFLSAARGRMIHVPWINLDSAHSRGVGLGPERKATPARLRLNDRQGISLSALSFVVFLLCKRPGPNKPIYEVPLTPRVLEQFHLLQLPKCSQRLKFVWQASANPRSVRSSPQSSCTGAWHPRKDDTHKSVRTWLKGQETKRIECYGCEFLGV